VNQARIRYFVQPPMSVVDRNFSSTNEVRMIMTSTAVPFPTTAAGYRPSAVELLVERLAVGMLRWSEASSHRRLASLERSVLTCRSSRIPSAATDAAQMVRHLRLG
jgi:hypothetical protein